MGAFKKVSPVLAVADGSHYAFFCAPCGHPHVLNTDPKKSPCWGYNDNPCRPTFTPSVLVRTGSAVDPTIVWEEGDPPRVCHSFVTNGEIQYLGDCDHELKGQTVPLSEWPEDH